MGWNPIGFWGLGEAFIGAEWERLGSVLGWNHIDLGGRDGHS